MDGERLFQPQNELEEVLLDAARTGDVEELLGVLSRTDLYVPTPTAGPAEEQRVEAQAGDELPLPLLERAGVKYVVAYTSQTQLARVPAAGTGYMRIDGAALAAVVPAELALVLNPGGDLGITIRPDQLAELRERDVEPEPDPDEQGFLVGEPREEPVELLAVIQGFGERTEAVEAAYRGLLLRRHGGVPEPVIGLQLAEGADETAVIEAAAHAAREAGIDALALVPIRPGTDAGAVARFLVERTEPFYVRAD
ncbi:MAG TPA: enhanced serine sensitivity protein SseB C-terminal domain-containing protein [Gaiellaceae bacterium]